jgi:hypothetical protein
LANENGTLDKRLAQVKTPDYVKTTALGYAALKAGSASRLRLTRFSGAA